MKETKNNLVSITTRKSRASQRRYTRFIGKNGTPREQNDKYGQCFCAVNDRTSAREVRNSLERTYVNTWRTADLGIVVMMNCSEWRITGPDGTISHCQAALGQETCWKRRRALTSRRKRCFEQGHEKSSAINRVSCTIRSLKVPELVMIEVSVDSDCVGDFGLPPENTRVPFAGWVKPKRNHMLNEEESTRPASDEQKIWTSKSIDHLSCRNRCC